MMDFGTNGDPCDRCRALGWVKNPSREWADKCPVCLGTTVGPSLYAIAQRIDENRTTIYRLRDMRVSAPTAERLFGKLLQFASRVGVPA